MPTYDYECKQCGHFEVFQNIKDAKLKRCPTCKKACLLYTSDAADE